MNKIVKAFNAATDSIRGAAEFGALYAFKAWILKNTPDGDSSKPVMILPGILAGDAMMAPLRDCIEEKGYKVYGWNGGVNMGFNDDTAEHLVKRLHEVYEAVGRKKITLIGHSLGGIFARELAREYPHMVEKVISLGSPFGMKSEEVPPMLLQLYNVINPKGDPTDLTDKDLQKRRLTPPPVPTTSIYSKNDGVVPWSACINPKTNHTENIEVDSSHVGMVYHPLAVAAVLDRLAQDPKNWKTFEPQKYSALYKAGPEDHHVPENPKWKPHDKARDYFKKK